MLCFKSPTIKMLRLSLDSMLKMVSWISLVSWYSSTKISSKRFLSDMAAAVGRPFASESRRSISCSKSPKSSPEHSRFFFKYRRSVCRTSCLSTMIRSLHKKIRISRSGAAASSSAPSSFCTPVTSCSLAALILRTVSSMSPVFTGALGITNTSLHRFSTDSPAAPDRTGA